MKTTTRDLHETLSRTPTNKPMSHGPTNASLLHRAWLSCRCFKIILYFSMTLLITSRILSSFECVHAEVSNIQLINICLQLYESSSRHTRSIRTQRTQRVFFLAHGNFMHKNPSNSHLRAACRCRPLCWSRRGRCRRRAPWTSKRRTSSAGCSVCTGCDLCSFPFTGCRMQRQSYRGASMASWVIVTCPRHTMHDDVLPEL
jgi:hypothetical protein